MDSLKDPHIVGPVGILGGGQLGCMLADAALALGLEPLIYAEASAPAAALFSDRVTLGTAADEPALRAFIARTRLIAFENEFVDCDLLERAARGWGGRFAPGLSAIRGLQDKLAQKRLFVSLGIPSADFIALLPGPDALRDAPRSVDAAYGRFGGQVVFKWSRMGYDGKGVWLACDSTAGRAQAAEFCRRGLSRGIAVYAEYKVAFRRELAIVACRAGSTGEFATYPLVLSEQKEGICRRVLGPAALLGADPRLEALAVEYARRVSRAAGLEGSFALELFETPEGGLLLNEVAPRVHNSGHYTQDACPVSQFENHWRGVAGLGLGTTQAHGGLFGMLNLLGPPGLALELPRRRTDLPFPAPSLPLRLHWYAKSEIRPNRKVGHVNAEAASRAELGEQLDLYQTLWAQSLRRIQERNPA